MYVFDEASFRRTFMKTKLICLLINVCHRPPMLDHINNTSQMMQSFRDSSPASPLLIRYILAIIFFRHPFQLRCLNKGRKSLITIRISWDIAFWIYIGKFFFIIYIFVLLVSHHSYSYLIFICCQLETKMPTIDHHHYYYYHIQSGEGDASDALICLVGSRFKSNVVQTNSIYQSFLYRVGSCNGKKKKKKNPLTHPHQASNLMVIFHQIYSISRALMAPQHSQSPNSINDKAVSSTFTRVYYSPNHGDEHEQCFPKECSKKRLINWTTYIVAHLIKWFFFRMNQMSKL